MKFSSAMTSSYALIVYVLLAAQSLLGQDAIESQLQSEQESFAKVSTELRDKVIKALQDKRTKAQRSGSLNLVRTIDSELEAFTSAGVLPKAVPTTQYVSQLERARTKVVTAFEAAVRKYTQDGKIELAETVQKQLDEFRGKALENSSRAFFNGRDLAGWNGNPNQWSVVEGTIVGRQSTTATVNSCLYTDKEYGDFELRCKLKLVGQDANSGIQIRSQVIDSKAFVLAGPQCDAGGVYWGSLYGENVGGMIKEAPQAIVANALRPDEFNDYAIRCVGTRVTITLNGQTTVDMNVPNIRPRGFIGFQLHRPKGKEFQVLVRELVFNPL